MSHIADVQEAQENYILAYQNYQESARAFEFARDQLLEVVGNGEPTNVPTTEQWLGLVAGNPAGVVVSSKPTRKRAAPKPRTTKSPARLRLTQDILDALPGQLGEIVERTGHPKNNVNVRLTQLHKQGKIRRTGARRSYVYEPLN